MCVVLVLNALGLAVMVVVTAHPISCALAWPPMRASKPGVLAFGRVFCLHLCIAHVLAVSIRRILSADVSETEEGTVGGGFAGSSRR
jgi:hypothetical protein